MEINFDQVIENSKLLISQDDIVYGMLPNYIQEPFSIINFESLNDNLDLNVFYPISTVNRIYSDDIFITNGIKLASPGKAMIDLLLSGKIDDIVELLEYSGISSEAITLRSYIQKYNLTNIIKNIIKNYNLEDFSNVLLEE